MLTSFFEWTSAYRPLFGLVVAICAAINNYLYFKHIKEGKCRADDFGYFIRLWRAKERDGLIVKYTSIIAAVSGVIYIVSLNI